MVTLAGVLVLSTSNVPALFTVTAPSVLAPVFARVIVAFDTVTAPTVSAPTFANFIAPPVTVTAPRVLAAEFCTVTVPVPVLVKAGELIRAKVPPTV